MLCMFFRKVPLQSNLRLSAVVRAASFVSPLLLLGQLESERLWYWFSAAQKPVSHPHLLTSIFLFQRTPQCLLKAFTCQTWAKRWGRLTWDLLDEEPGDGSTLSEAGLISFRSFFCLWGPAGPLKKASIVFNRKRHVHLDEVKLLQWPPTFPVKNLLQRLDW